MEIKNAKMVFDSNRFVKAKPAGQNNIVLASKEKCNRFLVNINKRMKNGEISFRDIKLARSVREGLNNAIMTVQKHGANFGKDARLAELQTIANRLDAVMNKIMLNMPQQTSFNVIKEYVSILLNKIKEFAVAVENMLIIVGSLLKDVANKLFEGIKSVFNWLKEHPAVATLLVACILSGVGYGIYSVGYKSAMTAGTKIVNTVSQTVETAPIVKNVVKTAPVVKNVVETAPAIKNVVKTAPVPVQNVKTCACNFRNGMTQAQCMRSCSL